MPDKFINKVIVDGVTKVDLTQDTVAPGTLMKGVTAHAASGASITGTADPEIAACASGTSLTLTDSADARVQGLVIKGRSTKTDDVIHSVGDGGSLTVTFSKTGETNRTATITTGLPLRSADENTYDELDFAAGTVTTRCYYDSSDNEVKPLVTPTVIPLTDAEISAFRALRTFDGTTNISITDEPEMTVDYLKNTDNGEAVSRVVDNVDFQINPILSEQEILSQELNGTYEGTDLTVKFASEIAASPYNGNPWAWIKARTTAGNFTGIHIGDYIPFTTTNNVTLNAQIAGINTYKNYGDTAVGNHIDWICKELWPTSHPVNKVNYNNGTAAQNHAWLASDLYLYLNSLAGTVPSQAVVGGGEGTAVDYTADGVYYYLPTQLKNVIIEKRFQLPKRYSASELLSDDNNRGWVDIGKLWLPDECEVYGMPVWGGKGGYSLGGSGLHYPLFAGNMNRLKFKNGNRASWWLLSPSSGGSVGWCYLGSSSNCDYRVASHSTVSAPVCFRT